MHSYRWYICLHCQLLICYQHYNTLNLIQKVKNKSHQYFPPDTFNVLNSMANSAFNKVMCTYYLVLAVVILHIVVHLSRFFLHNMQLLSMRLVPNSPTMNINKQKKTDTSLSSAQKEITFIYGNGVNPFLLKVLNFSQTCAALPVVRAYYLNKVIG